MEHADRLLRAASLKRGNGPGPSIFVMALDQVEKVRTDAQQAFIASDGDDLDAASRVEFLGLVYDELCDRRDRAAGNFTAIHTRHAMRDAATRDADNVAPAKPVGPTSRQRLNAWWTGLSDRARSGYEVGAVGLTALTILAGLNMAVNP